MISAVLVGIFWLRQNNSADHWLEEGRQAIDQRDFAKAALALENAVKASPDSGAAWKLLADAACRSGQPKRSNEALEAYGQLELAEAAKLGVQLASHWMTRNQIQPAIKALRLAAEFSPQSPEPYRLLAQIYGVTGHRADVVNCLMELIKRNAFTRDDLTVLSSINPSLNSPERLKLMLQADPSDKAPLISFAMSELDRNRVPSAKKYLLQITDVQPDDMEAQSILGELYADFEPDEFLDWNSRLPPQAEQDSRVWLARGKWLQTHGPAESTIRCLFEAIVREPESLSANMLMGQVLKTRGELELGNAFTERARRLQRIIDLSSRMSEPRADEWIEPMIEELEATGRLWEAWAWCVVHDQVVPGQHKATIACRERLKSQLDSTLPRTKPGSVPGRSGDWQKYPLPDWSQLKSSRVESLPTSQNVTSKIRFEDQGQTTGLNFQYVNTASQKSGHKIYETMGAGVGVLDYDQDGWPDLYFPQGNKTGPLEADDGPSDALYRNQSGKRFLAVTESAGIHETSYSHGVAAGDFNNDGFPDLYVANFGRNRLYRNNGDGTFSDVTDEAELKQSAWTVSCAIADLNGDGLPELFDVNYCQGKDLLTATCYDEHQRPIVCRPTMFDPATDTVCVNLGDGRFQELQTEAGLDLPQGMGLGLVIADFNDDQQLDVFIANDMAANFLLINETAGPGQPPKFRDEAFLRGVALDLNGLAQACMGVASADINRDGQPDLFVTNFARESNTLYLSQPGGMYQDQTSYASLREPSFDSLGFSTQFFDADHDGWFDLAVANGHIDEFVNEPFRMKAQFFRGQPTGRFTELTAKDVGPLFDELRLARGLALLDWNRDGQRDFVATDLERPVLLAVNTTVSANHSFRLKLVGTQSSRDAIGTKIRVVVAEGDERICQLTAGDGYESSNERIIEIGVGQCERLKLIEIRWPSGTKLQLENIGCDRVWLAIEGAADLIQSVSAE